MKRFNYLSAMHCLCAILCGPALATEELISSSNRTSVQDGWVTVSPPEFEGAINNPLKGFRDYKKDGYGLVKRQYIKWSDIEVSASDTVERIIAHTNKIFNTNGKRFEELNVKLVPRVYLDWNGVTGSEKDPKQHWPADLHSFDYDSPAFQDRLRRLVAKLGQACDGELLSWRLASSGLYRHRQGTGGSGFEEYSI
ncbi:MAG: hypothetical protein SGI77_09885 [Pirellulaceae bacterium]|nr:hypothetical protein [Pirellulaceae bacterium]